MNNSYEPIIGLEVHVELDTKSKMFCGCPADHFGRKPNTATCPVCLALPGALPVPNKRAIEWTIMVGLALGCKIPPESKFDRKNYFYPDLPKGYQISQYDQPIAVDGSLNIQSNTDKKSIHIRRVHLEEDTGKLQHATVDGKKVTLIDFNRSGVPLMEIVTEPDFRTIEEVDIFLKELQRIIKYLGVSKAEMEKGTMRLEPSISLRITGSSELPQYRVELKNINSFRFARRAIEYEIKRQTDLLEKGDMPTQQTRGWSEDTNATVAQREKEEAHDYRYFPEPDIPPMHWEKSFINEIASHIGELPEHKNKRFIADYNLSYQDATALTQSREFTDFFEEAVRVAKAQSAVGTELTPKVIANWIINKKIDLKILTPTSLIEHIRNETKVATMSAQEITDLALEVIAENEKAVLDYKNGKPQALMYLFGQAKRKNNQLPSEALVAELSRILQNK